MKLYLDLDSNQFVSDPLFKAPVESVSFKRGDAANLELAFVRGNTSTGLESGAAISFGIKESGKFDGDFLVFTDEYTSVADRYYLAPNFNTESLNDALAVDDNDGNDVSSLAAMLEISWSEQSGVWQSSRTITATIFNDLIRGDESTPLALPSPEDWLALHGIPYDPAMDGLTGGSNALDAIATEDLDTGRLQYFAGTIYRLNPGTAATNYPYIVRPADYASGTNEKYWGAMALRSESIIGKALSADDSLSLGLEGENKGTIRFVMDDDSEAALTIEPATLTANRTQTFPDEDGTVALKDEFQTVNAAGFKAASGGSYTLLTASALNFFGSYVGSFIPTTLTASRTWTVPNLDGTVAVVPTYANDSAAASGGLSVGDLYFTGSKFKIRVS